MLDHEQLDQMITERMDGIKESWVKPTNKFSVIVPLHNAERHMQKCLSSIINQTYQDFELILVCDACEDRTAQIARRYTDKVYEIDAHRSGLARNKGLDEAQGEWVLFLDDDDMWLHPFVLETISNRIGTRGEDILAFGFLTHNLTAPGLNYCYNQPHHIYPAIWNKCYRRSWIADRRFTDRIGDDDLFWTNTILPGAKIEFWREPLYYYDYMREGSITWNLKKNAPPPI